MNDGLNSAKDTTSTKDKHVPSLNIMTYQKIKKLNRSTSTSHQIPHISLNLCTKKLEHIVEANKLFQ